MPEMMAAYLMHFYNGISEDTAHVLVAEPRDKRSLRSLAVIAWYRREVQPPPHTQV